MYTNYIYIERKTVLKYIQVCYAAFELLCSVKLVLFLLLSSLGTSFICALSFQTVFVLFFSGSKSIFELLLLCVRWILSTFAAISRIRNSDSILWLKTFKHPHETNTQHTHTCERAVVSFTKRKRSSHSAKAAKMNRVNTLERNSAFRVSSLSDHTTCIAAWYANWVCMVQFYTSPATQVSQPTNQVSSSTSKMYMKYKLRFHAQTEHMRKRMNEWTKLLANVRIFEPKAKMEFTHSEWQP